MTALIHQEYPVAAEDYTRAGEASADIKRRLKQLGVSSMVLRRVAVASYEVELNLVIHSRGGVLSPTACGWYRAMWGRASRMWSWPCARAIPPPMRRRAAWALARAWACPI